jgi:RHS repeat-associated protein
MNPLEGDQKTALRGSKNRIIIYAGQYYDQETGLHYNYHRYYDPKLGRYLRADPIGLAGGINPYVYTFNNPVNLIDPFGLEAPIFGSSDMWAPEHGHGLLSPYTEAWRIQDKHFPDDPDPYGGAFRHCVAACLAKKHHGKLGELLRDAWDLIKEDPCNKDSKSDMEGEDKGEDIADSDESCESGCLKSYPAYKGVWGPKK